MGVAFYLAFDDEEFEADDIDGKSVAKAMDELTALANEVGVADLESFMGKAMDEFADMLGEEIEMEDGVDGGAKWFLPADGIATIDALVSALQQDPQRIKNSRRVLEDLADYKNALLAAQQAGVQWHLALDF